MTGKQVNPTTAALYLDEHFKSKKKSSSDPMKIVLIDELDAIKTTKQQVLYNLFDWPNKPQSKLIIVAIANTQDLPERLKGNIQSRIGKNRLIYQPYDQKQITEILRSRVDKFKIFLPEALSCVSRKIASLSGDIRRALQICK